ncbi:archease [Candidatus Poribacteria bacterium]|nr:archease [Candidatus Poribacteria bacterium]
MDGYEYLDHTADLGMRAYGKTLKELFTNAAQGMLEVMAATKTIYEVQQIRINVEAESLEDLMVTWLDELIFKYEVEEVLFRRVKIQQINEKELSAIAYGESPDLTKHVVYTEIKSVTYHQLVVEQKPNGDWFAQVIFDL